jgi:hypothetical protein
MMVVYLSLLLVIEIIYLRIMRLVMNDEPGGDLGGSGSGVLLIIILSAGRSGVPFPTGLRKYALLQNVQTLSGTQSANCSVGTGILSRR